MKAIDLKQLAAEERTETEAMIAELSGEKAERTGGDARAFAPRFIASGGKQAPDSRWTRRFIANGQKTAPKP
jgi:hypothetical protein